MWHILLTIISINGIIFLIDLYFLEGNDGTNKYGADPRC